MSAQVQLAFAFGVVFVGLLLLIAIRFPHPTSFQYTVFRIVLAIACAGVAVVLTGFLDIEIPGFLKAGGALAVFVVTYFYSPAALVSDAGWRRLREIWSHLRALDTKNPNMEDVVRAINALNETADLLGQQVGLREPFAREFGQSFCLLFLSLTSPPISVPHHNRSSHELLNPQAHSLASELKC